MTDRRYTYHPSKFVSSIKPSDSGYGGSLGSGNSQSSASVVNLREKRLRNQHTISEDFTDDRVVRKRQLMALDKVLCGGISKAANKSRSDRTQKPNTELLGRVLGDVKATSSSDMPGVDFEFVSSEIEDPSRPRLSNRVTTYVPGHRDRPGLKSSRPKKMAFRLGRISDDESVASDIGHQDRPGLKSSRPKKMAFRLGRISDDESVASDIGHQDRPRPKSSRPKTKKFQLGSDSDDGLVTPNKRRPLIEDEVSESDFIVDDISDEEKYRRQFGRPLQVPPRFGRPLQVPRIVRHHEDPVSKRQRYNNVKVTESRSYGPADVTYSSPADVMHTPGDSNYQRQQLLNRYYGVGRDSGNDAGYGSRDTYVSDQYDEPPGGRIHKFKDPGGKPNIVGTPLDMRFI